jgi:hypothetical protein
MLSVPWLYVPLKKTLSPTDGSNINYEDSGSDDGGIIYRNDESLSSEILNCISMVEHENKTLIRKELCHNFRFVKKMDTLPLAP